MDKYANSRRKVWINAIDKTELKPKGKGRIVYLRLFKVWPETMFLYTDTSPRIFFCTYTQCQYQY